MTAANKHKVPKKQWRKWSSQARRVFNEMYSSIKDGYLTLFPPAAQKLPRQSIAVVAWNSAWIAASACDEAAG